MKTLCIAAILLVSTALTAAPLDEIHNAMANGMHSKDHIAKSEENGRPYGTNHVFVQYFIDVMSLEANVGYALAVVDLLDIMEDLNINKFACIPKGTDPNVVSQAALSLLPSAYETDPYGDVGVYIAIGLMNRFSCLGR